MRAWHVTLCDCLPAQGVDTYPTTEPMFTILPDLLSAIRRPTALQTARVPKTLTSIQCRAASISVSNKAPIALNGTHI